MKFRPRVQLQVRSVQQCESIQTMAAVDGLSVNEWILRIVEKEHPKIAENEGLVIDSGGRARSATRAPRETKERSSSSGRSLTGKGNRSSRVTHTPSEGSGDTKVCPECNAVGGLHQRGCKRNKSK